MLQTGKKIKPAHTCTKSKIAVLLIFACLAAGCMSGPATERFDPLYDKFNEITLAGHKVGHATYVLDGFSVRWKKEPHRLNKIGAGMLLVRNDKDTGLVSAAGLLAFKGGSWSAKDKYNYQLDYTRIHTEQAYFYHGEVINIVLSHGAGEQKVALNLNKRGVPLSRYNATVFLRGFYLNTDKSHANGFPLKKFSVQIKDVETDNAGNLEFTARMELAAGPRDLYKHYQGKNKVEGKIFYTVVATSRGAFTNKKHSYELSGSRPAQESDRKVTIQGTPAVDGENYNIAFVGARKISFDWGDSAFLVRGVHFRNSDYKYDARTGAMSFICDAGMDNSGPVRFVNKAKVDTEFVLVQIKSEKPSSLAVRRGELKGTSDRVDAEAKPPLFFPGKGKVFFTDPVTDETQDADITPDKL